MDLINKHADMSLSDKDIMNIIDGRANLVTYPNLHKYKNIDQLLGEYGACIILFAWKSLYYGHWCLIFKVNDHTLEFFNSYGGVFKGYPDETLKVIEKKYARESNQDYPYLSHLMYNSPYDLTYNEYKFQGERNDIKTCGRHCAIRLICRYLPLDDYYQFLTFLSNKFNINYDQLVTLLTIWINKN